MPESFPALPVPAGSPSVCASHGNEPLSRGLAGTKASQSFHACAFGLRSIWQCSWRCLAYPGRREASGACRVRRECRTPAKMPKTCSNGITNVGGGRWKDRRDISSPQSWGVMGPDEPAKAVEACINEAGAMEGLGVLYPPWPGGAGQGKEDLALSRHAPWDQKCPSVNIQAC